jgi:arylsulfatase A-like enzyme
LEADPRGSAWQLFDLTADIAETADLAAKEPERVAELAALWDMRNAEQSEPLWK